MRLMRYTLPMSAMVLAALACSSGSSNQVGAVEMPSPDDTTVSLEGKVLVQVRNNYGVDVVLYVSYSGNRRRLGNVKTRSVGNYVITWRSGGFWMVVESVVDNRTVRSNGLDTISGARTILTIGPNFTAQLTPMD